MAWLFLVLFFVVDVAATSTTSVQAVGYSALIDGNEPAAYEQAKRSALREAVEEGIGVLLSSQTLVENFVAIEDHILTSTSGYVRSFRVVEQGPLNASTYQVKVEADVELGALHQSIEALDILIESAGNPYIVFLSQNQTQANGGNRRQLKLGTIMRESLERVSKQFNFMAAPRQYLGESLEDAARFGLESGADIVVLSSVEFSQIATRKIPFSRVSLEEIGVYSTVAGLSCEALWTDNGEVFSSYTRSERTSASTKDEAEDKALRRGGEVLADSLIANLIENWRQKVYSGRLVRLVAQMNPGDMAAFESDFSLVIGGGEKMYRRSYIDGIAVYDIQSKDSGFGIARQLTAYNLGRFDIVIQQVTPNSLKLQVANKI